MKEHPRLTLGEDFAQEKSWQWEDITVLTARLTLPQTKGESRREKRFDRYYRALADAYFARCEQKLLPDAAKTCRAAMVRSAPWQMTAVTLTYRVSAQTEDAVVFTFEVNDGEGVLRHWEEGWDCSAVLPHFKSEPGSAHATKARERRFGHPAGAEGGSSPKGLRLWSSRSVRECAVRGPFSFAKENGPFAPAARRRHIPPRCARKI